MDKKIIGILPVGGNAVRLGLPNSLSKPMLPQARQDKYIPVICHSINKMKEAGATEINFIHGINDMKNDIVEYFNEDGYWHIQQRKPNFANTLLTSITNYMGKDDNSRILFGLPDTVYNYNPYVDLVQGDGVSIALFEADDQLKVDRTKETPEGMVFDIKSSKNEENSKFFWGCFALDTGDLNDMIDSKIGDRVGEIGSILNEVKDKQYFYYGKYLDLGIWGNMNRYWSDSI